MARPEKEAQIAEVKEKIGKSSGAVFTDFRGLNVKQSTQLRRKLREAGVEYKVVKNTLALIAAKESGITGLEGILTGPTGIAFGYTDPVAPAKIISEFAKANKQLEIKGGLLNGEVISIDQVKALADLPGRDVLIARLLGGLQAPIAGLVNVLNGPIRGLVYTLDAIRRQKEEGATA